MRGFATEKVRSPSLSLVDCLTSSMFLADWFEDRPGTDAVVNCQQILQVDRCPLVDDYRVLGQHLPVHVTPSPLYPARQVHIKLPTVLVQLASALQPPLFVAHSLISTS